MTLPQSHFDGGRDPGPQQACFRRMLDRPVSPRRAQADSDEQCAAHPAHNPPSGKGTTWWPPDRGRAHSHPIPHRPSRAHQGGDSGRGWAGQAKPIPPYASPTPAIRVHMPKQDPLTRSQYRLCVTPQVSVHLNTITTPHF